MITSDITSITLDYYSIHGDAFVHSTLATSMSLTLQEFLSLVPKEGCILDWGCGSGRDSKVMMDAEYNVFPTDASPCMCSYAESLLNTEVLCEHFLELTKENYFDGIWACASLLHLPLKQIRKAFSLAHIALKPGGVMYASFKYGNTEGFRSGRWFTDLTEKSLTNVIPNLFGIIKIWKSNDVRPERGHEQWLNVLLKKAY